MIISKAQAGRLLGMSKQGVDTLYRKKPRPTFFIEINNKVKIETDNLEWQAQVAKRGLNKIANERRSLTVRAKKNKKEIETDKPTNELISSRAELMSEVELSGILGSIASSKIKQERAKQEEIKTAEIKKDLAPVDLIKYFFSFSEKIIQRIYRKPNDIEPQLAALFLAGENKKATQMLVRELESIITEVQKELISEIEKEGFKKAAKNVK